MISNFKLKKITIMKKVLIVLATFLSSNLIIAQTTSKVAANCTCQPGYTVCSADATFMSCCTCCQAGSSCGSWTAFGLAGCKCENTATGNKSVINSTVKFYFNKYNDFMNFLDKNKISSTSFRNFAAPPQLNKTINRGATTDQDYIVLEGDELKSFTDAYISDMKILSKDPNIAPLLDLYLNKK
jgi:hypothetical protein